MLPDGAEGSDAHNLRVYKKYMLDNCNTWLAFLRCRGLDLNMEDVVLVTGCHFAKSWAMAAFRTEESEASLQLHVGDSVGLVEVGWTNERNVESRKAGPAGPPLQERDQCVFIRGYHVKSRLLRTPKKLKGAAEPFNSNDDDPESDAYTPDISSDSEHSTSDCDVGSIMGMESQPRVSSQSAYPSF